MKKSGIFLIMWLICMSHTAFAMSGEGSNESPYLLSKPEDIILMVEQINSGDEFYIGANYHLTNDITMTEAMTPITSFYGTIDGQGYTISNFNMDVSETSGSGGFIISNNGTVKSLNLKTGSTGIVCGENSSSCGGIVSGNSGIIQDCSFEGSIYFPNDSFVGGLVGKNNYAGKILNCTTNVTILERGGNSYIGGLVGYDYGIVFNCHAVVDIKNINSAEDSYIGNTNVGGLIGYRQASYPLYYCSAKGSIKNATCYTGQYAGGLIGTNYSGDIKYCRAETSVVCLVYRNGSGTTVAASLIANSRGGNIYYCSASSPKLDAGYESPATRGYIVKTYQSSTQIYPYTDDLGDTVLNVTSIDDIKNISISQLSYSGSTEFYYCPDTYSGTPFVININSFNEAAYLKEPLYLKEKSGEDIAQSAELEYGWSDSEKTPVCRLKIVPKAAGTRVYTISNRSGTVSVDIPVKFKNNDFEYTISNGCATITKYNNTAKTEVVIPEAIDGYTVTTIAENSFIDTSLTSITIPVCVKTIDSAAFSYTKGFTVFGYPQTAAEAFALKNSKITFSQLPIFDIGQDGMILFEYTQNYLEDIIIPKNISLIKSGAFAGHSEIRSIEISSMTTEIEDGAFEGCDNLVIYTPQNSAAYYYALENNIKISSSYLSSEWSYTINADNTITITGYNSENYDDRVVFIPESHKEMPVVAIDSILFTYDYCRFAIPDGIEVYAHEYSDIHGTYYVISGSKAEKTLLSMLPSKYLESQFSVISMDNFNGLEQMNWYGEITYDIFYQYEWNEKIGDYSWFCYDEYGNRVDLDKSQNPLNIKVNSRYYEGDVTDITVPGKINGLSAYCEMYIYNVLLNSVRFSEGYSNFPNYSLHYCAKKVYLPSNVSYDFQSVYWIPNECEWIEIAEGNPEFFTENGIIYDNNSIRYIPDAMKKATIIDGVSIDYSTNYNVEEFCVYDTNTEYSTENGVLFNKNKTELIKYPSCKKDEAYTVPDSVTTIGKYSFYRCEFLESVTIPENVKTINNYTFAYSYSLKNVTIPTSVTKILSDAFYYCNALTDIYYGGTKSDWEKISIGSYNNPLKNAALHYKINIFYNANGGNNGPESFLTDKNSDILIAENTPVRFAHNFLGWALSSEATEPQFLPGESLGTSQEDITLYAVWKKSSYTTIREMNDIFLVTPTGIADGSKLIFVCYKNSVPVFIQQYEYMNEYGLVPFAPSVEYDSIKVFAWDGLDSMKPLTQPTSM